MGNLLACALKTRQLCAPIWQLFKVDVAVAARKICFLYNHDAPHQVAHTAPVVNQLVEAHPEFEITILLSNGDIERTVNKHLSPKAKQAVVMKRLKYPWFLKPLAVLNKILPFVRLANLFWNKKLFQSFDVFVSPETTILFLKTKLGLVRQKYIFIPHGAGDRSIGFHDTARHFDLVLVSGEKTRQRFINEAKVEASRVKIVGYPKFDGYFLQSEKKPALFKNTNPVFLYNPHFDPNLSSWYENGLAVLQYFKDNPNYNLVFAPHIMLFKRRIHSSVEHRRTAWRGSIPRQSYGLENIIIDVDSDNLIDMTYTKSANVYIGDASSQVYEFIFKPRPCIFIQNAHIKNWENDKNFRHWSFGPVIADINLLGQTIQTLEDGFASVYKAAQSEAFSETFTANTLRPSQVAAGEIAAYCKELP